MNDWRMMHGDSGVRICQKGSGAPLEKISHMMATGSSIFNVSVTHFILVI